MEPYFERDGITIYHGDFRLILLAHRNDLLDAIITDPPYPREHLPLYGGLAKEAARSLKRGGSLLSILPSYAIPQVVGEMSQHLKWRWPVAMVQSEGAHPRMAMGIEVCWKPVGWWVKGAWPKGRGFRRDRFFSVIPPGERRKKYHPWEQNISWANEMLRFVPPGGLVCDPMMGAGTLLVAAARAGYPAIGIDIDESACEIAAQRLSQQGELFPESA